MGGEFNVVKLENIKISLSYHEEVSIRFLRNTDTFLPDHCLCGIRDNVN
jgi:hypothetical protein